MKNTYVVTVTGFNEDFVSYSFATGGAAFAPRERFPNVEIGQMWRLVCSGSKIIECVNVDGAIRKELLGVLDNALQESGVKASYILDCVMPVIRHALVES